MRSQPASSKSSGGSTSNLRAYRVYRWLESIACWLRECFATSGVNSSSPNAPPVHNSVDNSVSGTANSSSSTASNSHVTASTSSPMNSSSAGKSPSSSNSHSGSNRRVNTTKAKEQANSKASSQNSHSPAEKSLPKNSASENCQKTENTNNTKHTKKNHQEKDDNGDGQYSRHTPTKKEKNNPKSQNHGEHLYTQIQKQDSIKIDDSQSNQNR